MILFVYLSGKDKTEDRKHAGKLEEEGLPQRGIGDLEETAI